MKFLGTMTYLRILMLTVLISMPNLAWAGSIALFTPLSDDYAELGNLFKSGAELALKAAGKNRELTLFDTSCDAPKTAALLEKVDQQEVGIAIGFYCNDPAKAVANAFLDRSIPVVVSAARSIRLIKDREREGWNLWRASPGDDYPVQIAAKAIGKRWKDKPFALVDDGTIYGRTFSDTLRAQLDAADLKPQFSDTFRAAQSTQAGLLRRLQRSGVTAAFIASATIEDLLIIAEDAGKLGVELEIMTTEAMMALPFLEQTENVQNGLKVIGWPQPVSPSLETLLLDNQLPSELAVYQGYSAMQIALEALSETPQETTSRLSSQSFNTALGPISFNQDGSSKFNPYTVMQWNGEKLHQAPPVPNQ